MKSLPKNFRIERGGVYYGKMFVATLHVKINLIKAIKDQKYLLRFGEKNREEVCGLLMKESLRRIKQSSATIG